MATIAEPNPSAFDLLVCCPSPLSRSQLRVDFSPVYDRQRHPDEQLEATIEKVWERRIAAQPSLYSALKFRYGGFKQFAQDGAQDTPNVILQLGLTDYKTFIGTNLAPEWDKFLASATEIVSNRYVVIAALRRRSVFLRLAVVRITGKFGWLDDAGRCRHTADPLGNGAIVETADHQILILQRSTDVGEFPGYLVFPGGHSEPEEVGIKSHPIRGTQVEAGLSTRIAEEMFDGITREIVEETGVPSSTLSDPVFIGLSRRKLNVRPTAFFYVKCSLTAAEVMEVYRHAEHSFESTTLLSFPPDDVLDAAATKMPGCHRGGAALYQSMRDEGRTRKDLN